MLFFPPLPSLSRPVPDAWACQFCAGPRVFRPEPENLKTAAKKKFFSPQNRILTEKKDSLMQEQEIISLIKAHTAFRTGTGFDVHRLVKERPLIIGGVNIPYEFGLLGHSDADVLVHAVMDALLGAAKLADIGVHFPDSDPRWKGADSLKLARAVSGLVKDRGFEIINVDSIIIAQKPKMSPYFAQMAANIAEALNIDAERVSVKATTTEKLGFCGAGEGVAAFASALVRQIP